MLTRYLLFTHRRTKPVNYCEAKDFEDDDDFACVKAPPSKKAREDVRQEQKKSSSKSSSEETNSQSTQSEKSRKPLDEKLLDRDLEAAITLSLLNGADGLKEESPASKADVKAEIPIDENTDPTSLHLSNCSVDGAVMGLDEITPEKQSPASARQRKSSSKAAEVKRKSDDDDEDYRPKLAPDSESDEDFSEPADSEDEEFTVKKASKAKKNEKGTKKNQTKPAPASKKEKHPSKPLKSKSQTAAVSTPTRSPPPAKLTPRPGSSCSVSTSKSAVSLSPAGGRIPKWNPPAQIGKSPMSSQSSAAKSPGQGLRLGLSRRVRVKPLHPSVASH
ncbi:RAD51-associated protein 1 [Leuresthes tenuis]|uniref:RAD51-associated protein 1 n=1 Tax=Leuresthes tenuis TaxID=355514 RepID=UPI003B511C36